MKVPSLNLGEWLERLGVRRPGWSPEMLEAVQPVQVIGDTSVLVPPLLPATAVAGGFFTSNVARTGCFQFACRAPSGAFVRAFRVGQTSLSPAGLLFGVTATPYTFVGASVGINRDMGPTPTRSVVTTGDTAGPVFTLATAPNLVIPLNSTISVDDMIFVPPGFFFQAENNAVGAISLHTHIVWQEIE